jgi:hypothetical protein
MSTTAKLFVTDYASYNNGTQFQFGHWVELDNFSDAEEFMRYVVNHLAECDLQSPIEGTLREEPMFTDFEGFSDDIYSETMSTSNIQDIYNYMALGLEDYNDSQWLTLHNEYCDSNNCGSEYIYDFEASFIESCGSKMEVMRATLFGEVNWSHSYIKYDGYGNFETLSSIEEYLKKVGMKDTLIEYALSR